jgi:isoamylase
LFSNTLAISGGLIVPKVEAGFPYPKGATYDGHGVNFAVFSQNAESIEICLFDSDGVHETARVRLPEYTNEVYHGYIRDLQPGQLYGLRVYGPYAPAEGHRFNANKLLLDPYAKQLHGQLTWDDALFGYRIGAKEADLSFDERDSAPFMPKCVVVDVGSGWKPAHPWKDEKRPRVRWANTVIYEAHVKGITALHPDIPKPLRGTFAGVAHPSVIEHLVKLGVTAIELMPVQAFFDDRYLIDRGLTNYWGYNTVGFFAAAPRYVSEGGDLGEFRHMVHHLHAAGIEVIIDVVYNHTAEGSHLGPTLCFRGIDNASYYMLADDKRYYYDTTGCGNTINQFHPRVLQMIMDSLRYWAEDCHVDGFRFDLASSLGREHRNFEGNARFFDAVLQDPALSPMKLIAEPWDVGEGGYRLGGFPPGWAEWNGRYRDEVRSYWRGDQGFISALARGLLGSADLFDRRGRRPWTSVNFVTAHDGFTLIDVCSYNRKHNEANCEGNKDGHDDNRSWNCGQKGPTNDTKILNLRDRTRRNLIATLLISQGTPMLLMGDEIGRTQRGNNNAYCQDNEISWLDWSSIGERDEAFFEFTRRLIDLRKRLRLLRQTRFLHGAQVSDNGTKDVAWFRPDGGEMTPEDWNNGLSKSIGVMLCGIEELPLLILANAHSEELSFKLGNLSGISGWRLLVDTAEGVIEPETVPASESGATVILPARAFLLYEGVR